MATLIKEIKMVFSDVTDNHNKVWYGKLFDNGDCLTEWGRIGYDLQSKEFPGAGESFLLKKQKEKERKGYTELKTVNTNVTSSSAPIHNNDLHSIAKNQLIKSSNPTLERLIKRFVDANIHKITSNTKITYNSTTGLFATPLGIVEQIGLDEAKDLLAQMAPMVRNNTFGSAADNLISKYLRLIPQSLGMGRFSAQSIIPDDNALQKQLDLIDSLESSYQATQSAPATPNQSAKPQEQVFEVDLDVLTDQNERNRLEMYFEKSKKCQHGYDNVRVREIFKVKIHDMSKAFEHQTTPVKEVFHGSSQANALSILKSGLKVSPPSTAAIAGKMMGNGLYGAINSTKSLGYTFGRWGQGGVGDSGWLWICDFGMGKIYETHYATHLPHGYDSVWAKAGKSLQNDELVVYRNTQANIKYLMEVK